METMNIFERLNSVNVNEHTEKKNGLTYLSWAWAWGEVKKAFPDANFTIYERMTDYGPVNYFTDGRTCWVKTGLTINGLEHIEELPVMDFRNNSIPFENVKSTDVNKAIQRSLTKAAARHGLGLYIYAGEDLPEAEAVAAKEEKQENLPKPDKNRKPNAAVSKGGSVPATEISNPVLNYLAQCRKELQDVRQISKEDNAKLFSAQTKALIKAGLAPDKPFPEYKMEEAIALITNMYQRFDPEGTEVKKA